VRHILSAAILLSLLLPVGAAESEAPVVIFQDVTEAAGLFFQHTFGDEEMSSILEATGSGCLFFDADGDGRLDLYAVNGRFLEGISAPEARDQTEGATNHLFHNQGDGTFVDVSAATGTDDDGYGMGAVAADVDADGDSDLYVTNYGANRLLLNDGTGRFEPSDAAADTLWGAGAVWFDMEGDGDVDLYVGNYLDFDPDYRLYYAADRFPGPLAYPGQPDVLYRNDDGHLVDITAAAGLSAHAGRAMGVTAADVDEDGHTDLFVANDAMANFLFHNGGDGTFVDMALVAGVAFAGNGDASSSMGGDFGDVDGDGDLDLFVPDMAFNNLYLNGGDGYFTDHTAVLGIAEASGQFIGWHGALFDADNDADLDLFVANGSAHYVDHTQQATLLANTRQDGRQRYVDIGGVAGDYFYRRSVSRGAAIADWDADGDLDLFVLHLDQPSVLLRNDGQGGHWLRIKLRGTNPLSEGIGARVRVHAGSMVQVRERMTASGYLGSREPTMHFGLGQLSRVDSVVVIWPGGQRQRLDGQRHDLASNQTITIVQEQAGP
jgi:enediyne biosynthesis protein E4